MVGTGETVAFAVTALAILGTGLLSSVAKRTFHAVIWLGACLISVAALFVLLGSPLVGVIQVLVYVGGILTLFVFAVMFVTGDETETEADHVNARAKRTLLAVAASLLIFGMMALTIRDVEPWQTEQDNLGDGDDQLDGVVEGIFGRHLISFEVLGILLTAAMIGALVIARPLGQKDDRENYSHPTKEQVRESTDQSDVRTHFPEAKA